MGILTNLPFVSCAAVYFRSQPQPQAMPAPNKMKNKIRSLFTIAALAAVAVTLTACESTLNTPQGKILSVTERGIGFTVSQSPSTQSPQVKFGFFSSAVVILPTQTNGTVSSPNFANTFDFNQSGALNLGIAENIASGNYQTLQPGQTNSALATQPIQPK